MYRVFLPAGEWLVIKEWGLDVVPDASQAGLFISLQAAIQAGEAYTNSTIGFGIQEVV